MGPSRPAFQSHVSDCMEQTPIARLPMTSISDP